MKYELELLMQGRKNVLGLIRPYSDQQLNHIPTGFRNNLIWHLGHIIVSQQIICYKYAGMEPTIPEHYISMFKRGTVPESAVDSQQIEQLKILAMETIRDFQLDYNRGIFKSYESYQSLYGVTLNTIEDAIKFNNTHEGIHMGYIMSIRKLLPQ